MNNFFRTFFAALLALIVFSGMMMFVTFIIIAAISSKKETETGKKAVLVLNLSDHFAEIPPPQLIGEITGSRPAQPSLHHLTKLIGHAADDNDVKGILLRCETNNNEFAASEEIRRAIEGFRKNGKFVIAYGNSLTQKSYYVASAANKIYCSPSGGIEWHGFSMTMPFIKGTLEKLEIEPQLFYAGKFKSISEPFREREMTDANRLQSIELLNDMYSFFLTKVSEGRQIDTATLRKFADSNTVSFASAALKNKMVDGLRYDDEVKEEIRANLKLNRKDKINFISPGKYSEAVNYMSSRGDKIVVIYGEGNIVDGSGDRDMIGAETYRNHIRRARVDESVKAIVFRVNSGGGSAVASEMIWRELVIAKKEKPVIVSFGDVAASGGYYVACGADSIFAEANTITGSIGVFGVIPNMQKFFDNKLGITFDDVKTSPDAGMMTVTKPLTAAQKQFIQNSVDSSYYDFKKRVSEGRKKSMTYIDSVAQGRVWSGARAVQLGLVDRIGSLDDAIAAAAAKARLKDYRIREYPGKAGLLEMLLDSKEESKETLIRQELGTEAYQTYSSIRNLKHFIGKAQARMPFELIIE